MKEFFLTLDLIYISGLEIAAWDFSKFQYVESTQAACIDLILTFLSKLDVKTEGLPANICYL